MRRPSETPSRAWDFPAGTVVFPRTAALSPGRESASRELREGEIPGNRTMSFAERPRTSTEVQASGACGGDHEVQQAWCLSLTEQPGLQCQPSPPDQAGGSEIRPYLPL